MDLTFLAWILDKYFWAIKSRNIKDVYYSAGSVKYIFVPNIQNNIGQFKCDIFYKSNYPKAKVLIIMCKKNCLINVFKLDYHLPIDRYVPILHDTNICT